MPILKIDAIIINCIEPIIHTTSFSVDAVGLLIPGALAPGYQVRVFKISNPPIIKPTLIKMCPIKDIIIDKDINEPGGIFFVKRKYGLLAPIVNVSGRTLTIS